jgi:hypothetical protein
VVSSAGSGHVAARTPTSSQQQRRGPGRHVSKRSRQMKTMPCRVHNSRTPRRYPAGGTMTPELPVTGSRINAAMVNGPSRRITCSRWVSARSRSSSGVLDPNADGYRNGPKKWTAPARRHVWRDRTQARRARRRRRDRASRCGEHRIDIVIYRGTVVSVESCYASGPAGGRWWSDHLGHIAVLALP